MQYNKFENQSETMPSQVVVQEPGQHTYAPHQQLQVHVPAQKWGWGTLILSVFSMCCCQIFGLIATISAITAYVDHKVKDFPGVARKNSMARGFAIAAIVIGVISIIVLIVALVLTFKTVSDIAKAENNAQFNFGN